MVLAIQDDCIEPLAQMNIPMVRVPGRPDALGRIFGLIVIEDPTLKSYFEIRG